jgi:hypothetical protein
LISTWKKSTGKKVAPLVRNVQWKGVLIFLSDEKFQHHVLVHFDMVAMRCDNCLHELGNLALVLTLRNSRLFTSFSFTNRAMWRTMWSNCAIFEHRLWFPSKISINVSMMFVTWLRQLFVVSLNPTCNEFSGRVWNLQTWKELFDCLNCHCKTTEIRSVLQILPSSKSCNNSWILQSSPQSLLLKAT